MGKAKVILTTIQLVNGQVLTATGAPELEDGYVEVEVEGERKIVPYSAISSITVGEQKAQAASA